MSLLKEINQIFEFQNYCISFLVTVANAKLDFIRKNNNKKKSSLLFKKIIFIRNNYLTLDNIPIINREHKLSKSKI